LSAATRSATGAHPGGESYRSAYLKELGSTFDASRVHFLGKVPYPRFLDVLRLSSAHVYLTYPFVLSWSLLEAMSCACAVIASDTAPVREVIKAGRNGLLVDFFAPDALAERIVSVLENPKHMAAMRTRARRDVQERFDLTRITLPRLTALVKQLAGHPASPDTRRLAPDGPPVRHRASRARAS
jgi:glycosyltransferase involved in cell wall biosynthesis